ncbi:hypothetical protein GCM10009754_34200 [Amycolatopsis minnesotensis]|uniref:PH domain-containing protein n=1 Tax=Amycolatopsis minnesotensis TaxID=337894 RepID=A0ABN2QYZ2_9PSEU
MPEQTDPAALGAVLSRYHVSHKRLLAIGAGALAAAAILCVLTIPMTRSGYSYRYSTAISIGICGISFTTAIAVIMIVFLVLRGLSETFDVRTGGLAHKAKGRIRAWPWQAVASLKPVHTPRSTWLTRMLIRDYTCAVQFADGAKIRFTGALDGYEDLEQAIRANCPQCTVEQGG